MINLMKHDDGKVLSVDTKSMSSVYLCMDVSQRNKVLVSRWNLKKDSAQQRVQAQQQEQQQQQQQQQEQQQLMTEVSKRCLPSPLLGKTLAKLHCKGKYLNLMFRQWKPTKMELEFKKNNLTNLCNENQNTDRTAALAKKLGVDVCSTIMRNLKEDYRCSLVADESNKQQQQQQRRSLIKRLSSNVLKTEATFSDSSSSSSSSTSSSPRPGRQSFAMPEFSMPDFPMPEFLNSKSTRQLRASFRKRLSSSSATIQTSFLEVQSATGLSLSMRNFNMKKSIGQVGRDVGMPLTYPIAYALTCAMQGEDTEAEEILSTIDHFWESYTKQLLESGKDQKFVSDAYRSGLGWCGWFLYVSCYRMTTYMDVLPLEKLCDEDKESVLDSIGCIGLHLMHLGFASSSSLSPLAIFEGDDNNDEYEFSSSISSSSSLMMDDVFNVDNKRYRLALEAHTREFKELLDDEITNLFEVSLLNRSSHFLNIGKISSGIAQRRQTPETYDRVRSGWSVH